MRILLLGEYSSVHSTLARGLRHLGHSVTVVSDGDRWKNYPRDVDLRRRSTGLAHSLAYWAQVQHMAHTLRGYDVVQLINPVFVDLRGERILPIYKRLRRQNGAMILGAFGIDKPWVEEGMKPETFRYSDFYANGLLRHNAENDRMVADWLLGAKGRLNDYIADDCDAIVSGLYEYHRCYQPRYAHKLTHIPFPIDHSSVTPRQPHPEWQGIRFFAGIQTARHEYKGTDIMLAALENLQRRYPSTMQIVRAENVPYDQYQRMMDTSDVMIDQLYSYTPAMNALLAMAKGLVVVGGGEEEHYQLIGEGELRPIVNVRPSQQEVEDAIEQRLLTDPAAVQRLGEESRTYTRRHHDHIAVARRYENIYLRNTR